MPCNYKNPAMIAEARNLRALHYKTACSEDEQLAAAESTVEDYIPLCDCSDCLREMEE